MPILGFISNPIHGHLKHHRSTSDCVARLDKLVGRQAQESQVTAKVSQHPLSESTHPASDSFVARVDQTIRNLQTTTQLVERTKADLQAAYTKSRSTVPEKRNAALTEVKTLNNQLKEQKALKRAYKGEAAVLTKKKDIYQTDLAQIEHELDKDKKQTAFRDKWIPRGIAFTLGGLAGSAFPSPFPAVTAGVGLVTLTSPIRKIRQEFF